MNRRIALFVVALLTLTATSAHAVAIVQYQTSYEVTLNSGIPDVTHINIFEQNASTSSGTWEFSVTGGATTTLTNPFPFAEAPTQSLLVGLATDSLSADHVVLFMDPTFASLVEGDSWETVFTSTVEAGIISSLNGTSGRDALDTFVWGSLAAMSASSASSGSDSDPAWFTTGGNFTVMEWSNGTVIGSGTSSVTATPEPATLLLLGSGLIGLGWVGRKRLKNDDDPKA